MAGITFDLFGDPSGLARTAATGIPYEIESLTPREVWGSGNSNTSIVCRQTFNAAALWIVDMVGTATVVVNSNGNGGAQFSLVRTLPEALQFGDSRVQFCSMVDQVDQGGNPLGETGVTLMRSGNGWPVTQWCKYRATFEAFPYKILTAKQLSAITFAAGVPNAGTSNLYHYVVRTRKTYSREQNFPGVNVAANYGFYTLGAPTTPPGQPFDTRRPIPGGVPFRVISMADVSYKHVRVPVGFPPPIGYVPAVFAWPPVANPVTMALPATLVYARDAYIGTVNSALWDAAAPEGYAWPAGSLLYTGYDDSNKYYDAAGNWVCDYVFNFKYKEGGWNNYLDANGNWVPVTADVVPGDNLHGTTAGRAPYTSNSFDKLFDQ